MDRFDEALVVNEENVATMRRLYGPNHEQTILAEEGVAYLQKNQGGEENLRAAAQTLRRAHAWRTQHFGAEDEDTLDTAGHLANTLRNLGQPSEAEPLIRATVAARRRMEGVENSKTLSDLFQLCVTLVYLNRIAEARQIRDEFLRVAQRVLGDQHHVTRAFDLPDLLERPGNRITCDGCGRDDLFSYAPILTGGYSDYCEDCAAALPEADRAGLRWTHVNSRCYGSDSDMDTGN